MMNSIDRWSAGAQEPGCPDQHARRGHPSWPFPTEQEGHHGPPSDHALLYLDALPADFGQFFVHSLKNLKVELVLITCIQMAKSGSTDDAVLENQLRALVSRLNVIETGIPEDL